MVIAKKEFIVLMAALMSFTALAIDAILPALSYMKLDLNVASDNHIQFVISSVFLGLVVGQLLFGPLSDKFGRKKGLYAGIIIFMLGTLIALFSTSFIFIILGRFLQGIGAASTRVISVAIIRDIYSGRDMARIMSFVMAVFIFVPVVAPLVGEGILIFSEWRMIFAFYLACAVLVLGWVYWRLHETARNVQPQQALAGEDLTPQVTLTQSFMSVLRNKQTLGYAIASGVVFAGFIGYLNSAQQIFQNFFSVGHLFSVCFGVSAASIGVASLVNGFTVKRFGIRKTCSYAMVAIIISSLIFMLCFDLSTPEGLFYPYMIYASVVFFFHGFMFGNFNALAMEPMGANAGMASSVIGSLSTAIAILGGTVIGLQFDMSLTPLISGFAIAALLSLVIHLYLVKHAEPQATH
jgi:DHA1 family bicyclomycin/chloramphenicol resistance-like MFS transporter